MTWVKHRREPYTEAGVRRLGCVRCGKPARFQWQVCSDGNNWRPLCAACDIALNAMVLEWDDGVYAGLDRRGLKAMRDREKNGLRALGNSVVPLIPELIGRALLAFEQ